MQLGIDFHASCEAVLRTGSLHFKRWSRQLKLEETIEVPPESHLGKLVKAAVPFAPPGALPEMVQTFTLFDRTVDCRIDYLAPNWAQFGDWKSSSGWGELKQNTMHSDLQANWQSHGIMVSSSQHSIQGDWVYANKKTYRAHAVSGIFTTQETERFLRERVLPVFKLIELFTDLHARGLLTSPDQIPHDLTACEGTGKFCSFLGHCRMQPCKPGVPTLTQLRAVR